MDDSGVAMRHASQRIDSPNSPDGNTLNSSPIGIRASVTERGLRSRLMEVECPMTDIMAKVDKATIEELLAKAADCELLGSLATDETVRQDNRRRAAEYRRLIEEAEALLKTQAA